MRRRCTLKSRVDAAIAKEKAGRPRAASLWGTVEVGCVGKRNSFLMPPHPHKRRDYAPVAIGIVVAVAHFLIYLGAAAFGLTSLAIRIDRGPVPEIKERAAVAIMEILSFPITLLAFHLRLASLGWVVLIVFVANSFFWGAAVAFPIWRYKRLRRRLA